jgi:A/G-specific adenine glycosylase
MDLKKDIKFFSKGLLQWHVTKNNRQMPWKEEKSPYKIWLSEVILQQTRVEQGLSYYLKFIATYPTITKLALAKDDEVFKLWEGLGYYSRCRNLLQTARYIAFELKGSFPKTYEEISKLKGVGPYTAAAIASFAFNLPYAVVDGNVNRVLARVFGINTPIDSTEGKRLFAGLAQSLLGNNTPAMYNQAIMDFGATICKPKQPQCSVCPFVKKCDAHKNDAIASYPGKLKKIIKTTRYFYFILAKQKQLVYLQQRLEKDIWQNLWQPMLVESEKPLSQSEIIKKAISQKILPVGASFLSTKGPIKQQLTHQTIVATLAYTQFTAAFTPKNCQAYTKAEIEKLAFPKIVNSLFSVNF